MNRRPVPARTPLTPDQRRELMDQLVKEAKILYSDPAARAEALVIAEDFLGVDPEIESIEDSQARADQGRWWK